MKPKLLSMIAKLRLSAVLFALLLLADGPAALASERHDHERARAAREAGRILPLTAILARATEAFPGKVLEVELEDGSEGRSVYEIKILSPGGRLRELYYDAATGELVGEDRPRRRRDRRE